MVEMILRELSSQRRRVLAFWIPIAEAGLRMVTGTTKSEVRIMFLLKSILRPCGLNCSPRMLSVCWRDVRCAWYAMESPTYTLYILRPFVDDVKLGVCLDKTARRSTSSRAHVGDEEATVWLSAYLIRDGGEQRTVALLELWLVRVGSILELVRSMCKTGTSRSQSRRQYPES